MGKTQWPWCDVFKEDAIIKNNNYDPSFKIYMDFLVRLYGTHESTEVKAYADFKNVIHS